MQVLVLAVQNAVDYSDLGVATSGATLFRSIGGSVGTAVLGSIFSNRLSSELTASLLPAARRRGARRVGGGRQPEARSRRSRRRSTRPTSTRSPTRSTPCSWSPRSWPSRRSCSAWFIRERAAARDRRRRRDIGETLRGPKRHRLAGGDRQQARPPGPPRGRARDRRAGRRARRRRPRPGRLLAARAAQRRRARRLAALAERVRIGARTLAAARGELLDRGLIDSCRRRAPTCYR